jgi:hypothetical protein
MTGELRIVIVELRIVIMELRIVIVQRGPSQSRPA